MRLDGAHALLVSVLFHIREHVMLICPCGGCCVDGAVGFAPSVNRGLQWRLTCASPGSVALRFKGLCAFCPSRAAV